LLLDYRHIITPCEEPARGKRRCKLTDLVAIVCFIERIQEEDRQFLAEYDARQATASQEHDTDSVPVTVLQEA